MSFTGLVGYKKKKNIKKGRKSFTTTFPFRGLEDAFPAGAFIHTKSGESEIMAVYRRGLPISYAGMSATEEGYFLYTLLKDKPFLIKPQAKLVIPRFAYGIPVDLSFYKDLE